MSALRSTLLVLPLLASAGIHPLRAGDKVAFGGAVSLNLPQGDLKTDTHDKVGGGLAFQVTFDLGGGHLLRPKAEVNLFRVKDARRAGTDTHDTVDLTGVGLGVDYLYPFGGDARRGAYALGGLSVQRWEVDYGTYTHTSDTSATSNETARRRTALGATLGLGYQVNAWFGLEARYAYSRYEGSRDATLADSTPGAPGITRDAGAFQLAATFRW
ncbi:MAG TPA: hypothetical protein VJ570_06270 [Holophagaceae bacterium]|nr:hypothetical protein [Holophagaceae bacterium]